MIFFATWNIKSALRLLLPSSPVPLPSHFCCREISCHHCFRNYTPLGPPTSLLCSPGGSPHCQHLRFEKRLDTPYLLLVKTETAGPQWSECGWYTLTSFQRGQCLGTEFFRRETWQLLLQPRDRVSITRSPVQSHADSLCAMMMTLLSCSLFSQNPQSQSCHDTTVRQIPTEC